MWKGSPFFWVAVLSLSWLQVGQGNVIFYKRHLLLAYVASKHLSENPAHCSNYPANKALLSECQKRVLLQGVEREKGGSETKCISVTHKSNARGGCPLTPQLALVSPSSACMQCSKQELAPPLRDMHSWTANMCAPSLTFIPSPTVLWGKFLRDASCYSILSHL